MNNKAFTISIALAGLAVFMIYSYVSSKEQAINDSYGTPTAVIVARKDIPEMTEIHENLIDIKTIPAKYVPPGKTTSKAEVVGFIAAVPLRKDEPITLNKIIAPGVRTGLSKQVTPGRRAVSIAVDDFNGVNRLVKPGDRIDVVTTIDPPGGTKGSQITKVVLQDIAVLAVGEYVTTTAPRRTERDEVSGKEVVRNLNVERNFNTITVEVDTDSALQLIMLRDVGSRLTVLLRNNDDTERVNVAGKTLLDILGTDAGRILRAPGAAQK